MYNGAAQRVAVEVASELVDVFDRLYQNQNVKIDDFVWFEQSNREIVARADREFTAAGALDTSRSQLLTEATEELEIAREAANNEKLTDMTNALKRSAARVNVLVVGIMGKLG